MTIKRKFRNASRYYTEEFLYPGKDTKKWKERVSLGGIYSDSEIGGEKLTQQNPWQGSQDQAKSEWP
jgi:hypothetical protein